MATIHNPTSDDLAFPNADGIEVPIPAGATVQVDAETAKQLAGHPLLKTGRAVAAKKAAKKAARARKRSDSTPEQPAVESAAAPDDTTEER